MSERRFETLADLATAFCADFAARLAAAIDRRGKASIALSGGRTPAVLYPILAQAKLDWARVTCTLTDERLVPADHPESNEGAVRSYFRGTPAAAGKFVGLYGDEPAFADTLSVAERRLNDMPWPLDLVHLGLGADGHIASLFPGAEPIAPAQGRLVACPAAPGHGPRISLSMRSLVESGAIFLAFTGPAKATVYEAARSGCLAPTHPLHLLLHSGARIEVYASP